MTGVPVVFQHGVCGSVGQHHVWLRDVLRYVTLCVCVMMRDIDIIMASYRPI